MPCSQNNKTFEPKSLIKEKCKSESNRQKRVKTIREILLVRFFDVIIDKLQKSCLQWAEEIQGEKRQYKMDSKAQRA